MQYSLTYILVILMYGVLAVVHRNTEKADSKQMITLFSVLFFLFFFGFRGFVFDDWIAYFPDFQAVSSDDLGFNTSSNIRYEPLFTLLMWGCKSIINSYQFFVFVCSFINTILLYRFFSKRTGNMPLALLLYISFGGLVMSTNLMRNSIAILIFVNALECIEQRKPIPYFLLCLLAIGFHLSAIMFVPLYFFLHRACHKYVFVTLFLIGNAIYLLHIPILMKMVAVTGDLLGAGTLAKIDEYTKLQTGGGFTLSVGYLERLFTFTIVLCYYNKLKEIRNENKLFINALLIYMLLLFFFSEFEEVSKRLSNVFVFAYWILWYDIVKCLSIINNRRLYIGLVALYCVLKVMGTAKFAVAEYDNVLFGAKTYQERLYIVSRQAPNN